MIILGIESSCDDTSVALLETIDTSITVLAQKTASQIDVHKKYGGVVPEIAGREHAEHILPVVEAVLGEWQSLNPGKKKPDCIAVTSGPGLITGLLVGIEVAKTLSYLWNIPLVSTNHIEGHMLSVLLKKTGEPSTTQIHFPALALVVSGGHTELVLLKDYGNYQIIGRTRDDAAGECFDKVAKLLGLEYPGGPKISKHAETGNTSAIPFPRPMLDVPVYEFSFAGLKTSALYYLQDHSLAVPGSTFRSFVAGIHGQIQQDPTINDFCASFEQAITDVLVEKTLRAAEEYHPKTVILGGGVSANKKVRETLAAELKKMDPSIAFLRPEPMYCMDNCAMIAVAGSFHAQKGEYTPWQQMTADPNWKVDTKK